MQKAKTQEAKTQESKTQEAKTRDQLIALCKERKIKGYSGKKKDDILKLLTPPQAVETVQPQHAQHIINAIDLFCGCGGMSKGLTDAGINVIAGIDVWDKAIESYKKNNPTHLSLCKDLTTFSPQHFQELHNTPIDLIVGGPPCQGFSIAGRRDTTDPRNSLFMEYVKYINYFKPKVILMENVMGILSMKTGKKENVIDIILGQLGVHYNCIVTKLYASDFEVPQNRRRIIIIGVRKDLGVMPTTPVSVLTVENRIPVKQVLLPRDQIDQSYYLSEKALTGIQNKKIKSKEKGAGFGAQILDMDKPSFTIPARYWKDGYDALVRYSDTEIRRLTIQELKRIQTFPDDYSIEGSKKDIIMQIGNAVPCRFAYHLGKHVIGMFTAFDT
jgi:DNA (cytosine-5)-methyltransferase 1